MLVIKPSNIQIEFQDVMLLINAIPVPTVEVASPNLLDAAMEAEIDLATKPE